MDNDTTLVDPSTVDGEEAQARTPVVETTPQDDVETGPIAEAATPPTVEIVREATGSHPQQQDTHGIRKRINKLNDKVKTAREQEEQATARLAVAEEKNQRLEASLAQVSQREEAPLAPNAEEFNGGPYDPEFVKKQQDYTHQVITTEVRRQVAEAAQQYVATTSRQAHSVHLEQQQKTHYVRAHEIGAPDYTETEDKAIEVLGMDVVNQVIGNFDDAHLMLYYLGKNTPEAERLSQLLHTAPIQGVAELGRLRAELKVKPKTQITPAPDVELEGGTPGRSTNQERRLEALRTEAAKTGDLKPLLAFKRTLGT